MASDSGITDSGNGLGSRSVTSARTDTFYSDRWQAVEDRRAATQTNYCYTGSPGEWTLASCNTTTTNRRDQQVWGQGYVDDLVLRDRSATGVVASDPSFDGDGRATTDFSAGADLARSVAVQPGGGKGVRII